MSDKRTDEERKRITTNLRPVEERSSWGTEYITIGAFYDFGRVWECPRLYPRISAYWDIPRSGRWQNGQVRQIVCRSCLSLIFNREQIDEKLIYKIITGQKTF